jgi:hypothetical protein
MKKRATLPFEDLEQIFDLLAQAVDDVGIEQERLFLAKLALTLSHKLGDLDQITNAIEIARRDLRQ